MSIEELQKTLDELSSTFHSLSIQDQKAKENQRLGLSLGHSLRIEKAKAFEEIKDALTDINNPADKIKYLKDLSDKAGLITLPSASNLAELKSKMGEGEFQAYIMGRAARDLLGHNSHGYQVVQNFAASVSATDSKATEKKIIDAVLEKAKSVSSIDELTTYLEELKGIHGEGANPFIDSLIDELTEMKGSLTNEESAKLGEMSPFQRTGSDEARAREQIHQGSLNTFRQRLEKLSEDTSKQLETVSGTMEDQLTKLTSVLADEVVRIEKEANELRTKSLPQEMPPGFVGPLLPNQRYSSSNASITQTKSTTSPQQQANSSTQPPTNSNLPKAASFGLSFIQDGFRVKITDVKPGSAAERSGLLVGDYLTYWDDNRISSERSLKHQLENSQINTPYKIQIVRAQRLQTITIRSEQERDCEPALGISYSRHTTSPWWSLGFKRDPHVGVYIEAVDSGSPAQKLGLSGGDIISQVNGVDITKASEFKILWAAAFAKGEPFTITIRDKGTKTITPSSGAYYRWADQNVERDSRF